MKYYLLISFSFLSLSGCIGQWDYCQKELNDYFSISWVDHPQRQGISFSRDPKSNGRRKVIECYVFACGKSKNFIIAKQHPSEDSFCRNTDLNITNYYIIENINLSNQKDFILHGPIDSIEFQKMKEQLKIDDIKFTFTFPEDPNDYGIMRDYL